MLAVLGMATLAFLAGCGTGEYNRRFQVSLTESGRKAEFDTLLHPGPTPVTDGGGQPAGVQLRLPKVLDGSSQSLPSTTGRAQPPFLKIPGFAYAMERLLDDGTKTPEGADVFAPVYCYLAAVPKADQKPEVVSADVQKLVIAAFPQAAWQDTSAGSPTGGNIPLKVLTVSGQQDFDNGQNMGPVVKLDGRMDLYFYEGQTHFVFIGFRAPLTQATKYQFFEAGKSAMGTIEAGAAAPAPVPAAPAEGQPAAAADPNAAAAPAAAPAP